MKLMRWIQPRAREKGQSLMELAVSITVLFIILAGLVDLGRVYFQFITMRDAAQEAASYGSVFPTHCDQIRDRAWVAMNTSPAVTVSVVIEGHVGGISSGAEFSEGCLTSAGDTMKACHGNQIRVTLSDPEFPITMPFIGAFIGSQTIPLSTTITDSILRPPCR